MNPSIGFSILLALGMQMLFVAKTQGGGPVTWTVDLVQGSIEGQRTNLVGRRNYYAFRTIPFAKPPVGPLRFKDPQPADPWTGVRNGSADTPVCPQVDIRGTLQGITRIIGSEDCLFLNVFTPGPSASNLPVMVYIHGGGFSRGDAYTYEPDHLLQKDVIVVVIQYRMNIFGFLSTEDSVMPGNLGLKDQVLALQWVQQNIHSFGGDPEKVTIFGQSAGATSVHYLMMIPAGEGLFIRAIAQSGTILTPSLLRDDHRENAIIIAQRLNCSGIDPSNFDSELFHDCLSNFNIEQLIAVTASFIEFAGGPRIMMLRVDGEFIPDHPVNLLKMKKKKKSRNIDFMVGINRDEGGFFIRPMLLSNATLQALAQNFEANGPLFLVMETEDFAEYIAKRMFYHYANETSLSFENSDEVVQMFTDYAFAVPMEIVAKFCQRNAPRQKTYIYEFIYQGLFSFVDTPSIPVGKDWVSHVDETQYFFSSDLTGNINGGSARDLFMSEIMVSLWVNFASTGNPTPDLSLGFKWPAISRRSLRYMMLQPSPFVTGFRRRKEVEFFTNLPLEINKLLFPERFYPRAKRNIAVADGKKDDFELSGMRLRTKVNLELEGGE